MRHELITREPELYFDSLHQELDNFLRDTFFPHAFAHPLNVIKNTMLRPVIEVVQNKDNYKVKVQLPGVKKEDIDIELDNDFMTICAETKEEKCEEGNNEQKEEEKQENQDKLEKPEKRYHASEFRYGKYQRTISFDQPIKIDETKAEYKDGILTIIVPKQEIETKEPKKIEIN